MTSKPSYANLIVEAALALKSRKGASRVAIKKYIESNNTIELSTVYFRNGFQKALKSGALVFGSSKGTFKAVVQEPKKAKKPVKKTTKKKTTKKKTSKSKGSDYKTIKGKKYDKGMLDAADAAVAGANDNVISMEEAQVIIKEALDGHVYTSTEKTTMQYIRDNYKFTEAADKLVRKQVASFAAKKAAKAKKAAPKKKTTKKKTTKKTATKKTATKKKSKKWTL